MCDYSLQGLPNRLAREGEQLITHRFCTGSIGLAAAEEVYAMQRPGAAPVRKSWWSRLKAWVTPSETPQITAVCIPPGTTLLMSQIHPRLRRDFGLGVIESVTFDQLTAEAFRFRDAVRLGGGKTLLLQTIPTGVRFAVVSLGSSERATVAERRDSPSLPAA